MLEHTAETGGSASAMHSSTADLFHGFTPFAAGNLVHLERPRINRLLDKAIQKPMVTVVAGAGYGKTCAVYGFAKRMNIRTAWVQLSEEDNIVEFFWENFVSAVSVFNTAAALYLRKIEFPAGDREFERFLTVPQADFFPNEKYLFVYDDFHLITEKTVLRFLEKCFSFSLPNITTILISRTEPAISAAKQVSKNNPARITENELRFSLDETISFFKLRNINPSPSNVSSIYHTTEGWPFALHLASLSLTFAPSDAALNNSAGGQGETYISQTIRSGIFAFIETEIMKNLSPGLRHFLVKLSLIENLYGGLVREIAQEPTHGKTDLIKEMEEINSFIYYDSFRGVYHFNNFLGDFLRERQPELVEEEKNDVWTRAAVWCIASNRKMDAINYHEKTENYTGIIGILNSFPLILVDNMARFILDLLDRAPKTVYRDYPELIVIRSRVLGSIGRHEQSRKETLEILGSFESLPESREKHRGLKACFISLGLIGFGQSIHTKQYDFMEFFIKAALEAELSGQRTDTTFSDTPFSESPFCRIIISSHGCRVLSPATKEDIETFIGVLGELVPLTVKAMGGSLAGLYELARGEYAFFRGEPEEAEKELRESLKKAREWQQYEIESKALFYLLRICLFRGDEEGIKDILNRLNVQLKEPNYLNRHLFCDIITGWFYAQTNQNEKIAPWLKSDYEESSFNSRARSPEKLVRVKYYYTEKHYPAALAVIENRGDVKPLLMADIEMKTMEAACRLKLHDKEGALRALEEAYNLAAPAGLFMPFAELGKDMRTLTETAKKDAALPVHSAVSGRSQGRGKGSAQVLPAEWLDKTRREAAAYAKKLNQLKEGEGKLQRRSILSRREKDVLTGISQGLTREEIAGASSISPNTVKSVIRSIYGKLGALNKADAVRIASEKGLL